MADTRRVCVKTSKDPGDASDNATGDGKSDKDFRRVTVGAYKELEKWAISHYKYTKVTMRYYDDGGDWICLGGTDSEEGDQQEFEDACQYLITGQGSDPFLRVRVRSAEAVETPDEIAALRAQADQVDELRAELSNAEASLVTVNRDRDDLKQKLTESEERRKREHHDQEVLEDLKRKLEKDVEDLKRANSELQQKSENLQQQLAAPPAAYAAAGAGSAVGAAAWAPPDAGGPLPHAAPAALPMPDAWGAVGPPDAGAVYAPPSQLGWGPPPAALPGYPPALIQPPPGAAHALPPAAQRGAGIALLPAAAGGGGGAQRTRRKRAGRGGGVDAAPGAAGMYGDAYGLQMHRAGEAVTAAVPAAAAAALQTEAGKKEREEEKKARKKEKAERQKSGLSCRFVMDIQFKDNAEVGPGSIVEKRWALRNNGSIAWPEGTYITYIGGDPLMPDPDTQQAQQSWYKIPAPPGGVQPMAEVEVSFPIKVPKQAGRYYYYFKLRQGPEGELRKDMSGGADQHRKDKTLAQFEEDHGAKARELWDRAAQTQHIGPVGAKFGQRLWAILVVVKDADAQLPASSEPALGLPGAGGGGGGLCRSQSAPPYPHGGEEDDGGDSGTDDDAGGSAGSGGAAAPPHDGTAAAGRRAGPAAGTPFYSKSAWPAGGSPRADDGKRASPLTTTASGSEGLARHMTS